MFLATREADFTALADPVGTRASPVNRAATLAPRHPGRIRDTPAVRGLTPGFPRGMAAALRAPLAGILEPPPQVPPGCRADPDGIRAWAARNWMVRANPSPAPPLARQEALPARLAGTLDRERQDRSPAGTPARQEHLAGIREWPVLPARVGPSRPAGILDRERQDRSPAGTPARQAHLVSPRAVLDLAGRHGILDSPRRDSSLDGTPPMPAPFPGGILAALASPAGRGMPDSFRAGPDGTPPGEILRAAPVSAARQEAH
jgi:hypothetical protein